MKSLRTALRDGLRLAGWTCAMLFLFGAYALLIRSCDRLCGTHPHSPLLILIGCGAWVVTFLLLEVVPAWFRAIFRFSSPPENE